MSPGRKKYDGDFAGRSVGLAERRNTLPGKGKINFNASAKRTGRLTRNLKADEALFAEDGEKDRYLITYADLITLLLGLFIILYAVSNIDLQKYRKFMSAFGSTFGSSQVIAVSEQAAESGKIISSLKSDVQDLIEKYNYDKMLNVEENERGVTIHILEDILFKSGSAELNGTSLLLLGRLSSLLKIIPNDIRIEGHTDNIPISTHQYPSNWHLSVARALNTAYHFINNEMLPADKISIVGYSEYKPVSANETEEGRKLNRRVDLVIIKK